MTAFYNTTAMAGDPLRDAVIAAQHQDAAVLAIFTHARRPMSPSEVHAAGERAGLRWLTTSVRRSMSSLTTDGLLERTEAKRMGLWGRPEYLWQLAQKKIPATEDGDFDGLDARRGLGAC